MRRTLLPLALVLGASTLLTGCYNAPAWWVQGPDPLPSPPVAGLPVRVTPEPLPTPEPTPVAIRVPDVVGMARVDAQGLLLDAGFVVRIRLTDHVLDEPGIVLDQAPARGTSVAPGSRVTLDVSRAPVRVEVPDVRGLREADFLAILFDAGLRAGARHTAFSTRIPVGRIVSVDPRAGTPVEPRSRVGYTVSLGEAPAVTPSPSVAP